MSNEKRVECPSALCRRELVLPYGQFQITDNEDGTWCASILVHCTFCNLVFSVTRSRVEFCKVHYPTIAEMQMLPRYQEKTMEVV